MNPVTLKDVAQLAGVSRQAVSLILSERGHLFREETRERVFKAARQLNYRPNAAARAVATNKTRQIGVLVINHAGDPITFPFTYYLILGINLAMESAGYVVSLIRIGDVAAELDKGSRVFREHVLDGMIIATPVPDHIVATVERRVPVSVCVDTNVWRPTLCVRRDEYQAGYLAAKAAIDAGYTRIVYYGEKIDAMPVHFSNAERERGCRDACEHAGLRLHVIRTLWSWTEDTLPLIEPYLSPDTAFVLYDYHRVRLVERSAMMKRLIAGQDFGMVNCDIIPEGKRSWPELSGIEFDRMDLGRTAAEMLVAALADQPDPKALVSVTLPCELVTGTTLPGCRKPQAT